MFLLTFCYSFCLNSLEKNNSEVNLLGSFPNIPKTLYPISQNSKTPPLREGGVTVSPKEPWPSASHPNKIQRGDPKHEVGVRNFSTRIIPSDSIPKHLRVSSPLRVCIRSHDGEHPRDQKIHSVSPHLPKCSSWL